MVNAVCHRDYTSAANTTIRLYDDHLEIWNPGTLTHQLRPEQLLMPHNSFPPNRLIAESFYNAGIIENWGTGTIRIAEALKEQRLVPPKFDVSMTECFRVIFDKTDLYNEQRLKDLGLNARQIKAIRHLCENEDLTNAQYQRLCAVSKPTVTRDLSDLVERGLIVREGATGKGTRYKLS